MEYFYPLLHNKSHPSHILNTVKLCNKRWHLRTSVDSHCAVRPFLWMSPLVSSTRQTVSRSYQTTSYLRLVSSFSTAEMLNCHFIQNWVRHSCGGTIFTKKLSARPLCTQQCKCVDVTINDTLTWSDHINTVCAKLSCSVNCLRRLSLFLPQPLLLFLKSYILPLFD